MMVLMYTRNGCMPCKAAKRLLDQLQVPYKVFTLPDDPEAAEGFSGVLRGHRALPVIIFPSGRVVEGYFPDRIKKEVSLL